MTDKDEAVDRDGKTLEKELPEKNMVATAPRKTKKPTGKRKALKRKLVIELKAGVLDSLPEQIAAALSRDEPRYFRRDQVLMRAVQVVEATADESGVNRPVGAMTLVPADPHNVARDLAKVAQVIKRRDKQRIAADLPIALARAFIAASPELTALPVVRGIVTTPILREDGSIFFTEGYDPITRLILDARGARFNELRVPYAPSADQLREAHRLIREPFADFPFVSPQDHSVALSALFSSIVRPALPTCPLHGFSAPSFGAGKSLLEEVISVVSTGQRATSITYGHSQDEFEKRVDAVVLAGDPVVCLDNISAPLGGDNLCSFITSASARIRVLGRSDLVTMPCSAFWMASGVNLIVRGDMVRRSLIARIDPNTVSPEERTGFKIPRLIEWATENRMPLLSAVFTVLIAHQRAGFPGEEQVLASFPEWSRRVRAPLIWLGEADPVASQKDIAVDDPVLLTRRMVFEAIYAVKRSDPFTTADLSALVSDSALSATDGAADLQRLAEALQEACGKTGVTNQAIGYFLRGARDVIAGGLKLQRLGEDNANRVRYRLIPK